MTLGNAYTPYYQEPSQARALWIEPLVLLTHHSNFTQIKIFSQSELLRGIALENIPTLLPRIHTWTIFTTCTVIACCSSCKISIARSYPWASLNAVSLFTGYSWLASNLYSTLRIMHLTKSWWLTWILPTVTNRWYIYRDLYYFMLTNIDTNIHPSISWLTHIEQIPWIFSIYPSLNHFTSIFFSLLLDRTNEHPNN